MNEYSFTFGTGASLYFGRGFCFRCMICLFDQKLFVRNKLLVFFYFIHPWAMLFLPLKFCYLQRKFKIQKRI